LGGLFPRTTPKATGEGLVRNADKLTSPNGTKRVENGRHTGQQIREPA